jgi:hypothetical protein
LLLIKDPIKRIKIETILKHSFFNKSFDPLKTLDSLTKENIPPKVSLFEVLNRNPLLQDSNGESSIVPLTTQRLQPIRQETKHGIVEILKTGELVLDFAGDRYRMLINAIGDRISFFEYPLSKDWNPSIRPSMTFEISNLPQKYFKKYRYASRFINMVRCKTPKVIFYSPQSKCMLMENGMNPDIECFFYTGKRISWSPVKGEVCFKDAESSKKISLASLNIILSIPDLIALGSSFEASIPDQFVGCWRHLLESYRLCCDVSLEDVKQYPCIIKCESYKNRNSSKLESNSTACPVSIHMSQVSSNIVGSTSGAQDSGNYSNIGPRPTSEIVSNYTSRTSIDNVSTRAATETKTVDRNIQKEETIESREITNFRYINDVGWCIQCKNSSETIFRMLLNNGIQLIIESPVFGSSNRVCFVRYVNQAGANERLPIDKNLPAYIKQNLIHFPRFVKLFVE